MEEYLEVLANGMEEVQNLGVNSQQDILASLGVTESTLIKYQRELGFFMQQLMMNQQSSMAEGKPMTLE